MRSALLTTGLEELEGILRLGVAILCVIAALYLLTGCEGGGYKDEALKKQATRSLQRISGALEQYRMEFKSYPAHGADLEKALSKYFVATDTAGNVTNEWTKLVENSFWEGVTYETPDSLYSYFLTGKALDTRHTPLTARSNLKRPEEGKSKKKKR